MRLCTIVTVQCFAQCGKACRHANPAPAAPWSPAVCKTEFLARRIKLLFAFLLNRYTKETSTPLNIWTGRTEHAVSHRWSASDQIRSELIRSEHSHSHTTFYDATEGSGQFNLGKDFSWRDLIWFLLVHVTYCFIFSHPWWKCLSWLNRTENFDYILPCYLVTKCCLIPFMS